MTKTTRYVYSAATLDIYTGGTIQNPVFFSIDFGSTFLHADLELSHDLVTVAQYNSCFFCCYFRRHFPIERIFQRVYRTCGLHGSKVKIDRFGKPPERKNPILFDFPFGQWRYALLFARRYIFCFRFITVLGRVV